MAAPAERTSHGYQDERSNEQLLLDSLRIRNPRAWMAVTNNQGTLMPRSLLKLCKNQAVQLGSQDAEHLLQGLLDAEPQQSDNPDGTSKPFSPTDSESLKTQFAQLCRQFASGKQCLTYEEWLNWDELDGCRGAGGSISTEAARSLWLRWVGDGNSANETDFVRLAQVMRQECGLATTIQSFIRGSVGRRTARHHADACHKQSTCLEAVKLAPYNPTPDCAIKQVLDTLEVQSGDTLFDLGCGDGRMLLAAARRGARAVGVEYDTRFAEKASRAIREAKLESLAKVICGDAQTANLSEATKIFVYLVPDGLRRMNAALSDASQRGVPIASYLFSLPGWSPHAVLTAETRGAECKVWIYRDSAALPILGNESEQPAMQNWWFLQVAVCV